MTTSQALWQQWLNPIDTTSLLMVIGGDVVQKALAAGTGTWWFTPVCFSFGWVSYAFVALINIIGDGCLLPEPDSPVLVTNLESGYTRQNCNWALGRFMRDCEARFAREHWRRMSQNDDEYHLAGGMSTAVGIRITVFKGYAARLPKDSASLPLMKIHAVGTTCIILQLALAIIPITRLGQWDIMLITAAGTFLVQLAGCLPQWRFEKLPKIRRKKAIALTRGNGSHDIVVVLGDDSCWDLETFAAPNSPRIQRGWTTNLHVSQNGSVSYVEAWTSRMLLGFPRGYWLTIAVTICQSIMWLAVLVNVASPRDMNWILIAIGLIGVFQNAYLAGIEGDERQLNLHLEKQRTFETAKVMDGIMDFELEFKKGKHLLREFFNGELRAEEKMWWEGNRDPYDKRRQKQSWRHGRTPTSSFNISGDSSFENDPEAFTAVETESKDNQKRAEQNHPSHS